MLLLSRHLKVFMTKYRITKINDNASAVISDTVMNVTKFSSKDWKGIVYLIFEDLSLGETGVGRSESSEPSEDE